MPMLREIQFVLAISAEQYRRYYRGQAHVVQVRSVEGEIVQFPASVLKPHLTHAGIHGRFVLQVDADHRVAGLRRIGA